MWDAAQVTIFGGVFTAIGAIGGTIATAVMRRGADNTTAEAAFQVALNGATTAYTTATEGLIARQDARLKEQDEMIRDLGTRLREADVREEAREDAMRTLQRHADDCDAESRQMKQRMESLETLLRNAGYNIPARGAVTELQIATVRMPGGADVTEFSATHVPRKPRRNR